MESSSANTPNETFPKILHRLKYSIGLTKRRPILFDRFTRLIGQILQILIPLTELAPSAATPSSLPSFHAKISPAFRRLASASPNSQRSDSRPALALETVLPNRRSLLPWAPIRRRPVLRPR